MKASENKDNFLRHQCCQKDSSGSKNCENLSDEVLLPVDISERFSRILVDTVGTDRLKSWVKANRGAMVLCRSGSG